MTKTFVKPKKRLSDKYRGIFSKEQGENLNKHIKQVREEWDLSSNESMKNIN